MNNSQNHIFSIGGINMKNIEMKVEGNKLTITVDLSQRYGINAKIKVNHLG